MMKKEKEKEKVTKKSLETLKSKYKDHHIMTKVNTHPLGSCLLLQILLQWS